MSSYKAAKNRLPLPIEGAMLKACDKPARAALEAVLKVGFDGEDMGMLRICQFPQEVEGLLNDDRDRVRRALALTKRKHYF
ncbi:hypothetical protein COY07_03780 [Candidatus Peregrinibacteria bacterium CG_4_10_14_0_2_um_filter_43_11]|nr:MAG: hypothetical protein COY07_03780 [Candidatus Peregrinibacteria bacterium CG_4_10_14_0_2_um_filter_43_11]